MEMSLHKDRSKKNSFGVQELGILILYLHLQIIGYLWFSHGATLSLAGGTTATVQANAGGYHEPELRDCPRPLRMWA